MTSKVWAMTFHIPSSTMFGHPVSKVDDCCKLVQVQHVPKTLARSWLDWASAELPSDFVRTSRDWAPSASSFLMQATLSLSLPDIRLSDINGKLSVAAWSRDCWNRDSCAGLGSKAEAEDGLAPKATGESALDDGSGAEWDVLIAVASLALLWRSADEGRQAPTSGDKPLRDSSC